MIAALKNWLAKRRQVRQDAACTRGEHDFALRSQFQNGCWAIENFFRVCCNPNCNHAEFSHTKINYD